MEKNSIILSTFMITIIISACLILSGFIELSQDNDNKKKIDNNLLHGLEVHEWGVFCHEYNSNVTSFLTAPPHMPVFYDKPVIYFHCNETLLNVSVEVDIGGDIHVTIPDANITESGIGWIVDIENNSVVAPDGTSYDYLFYEGQMNISQGVVSYVVENDENVTFYVKNIANYTISDVFFIYGKPYDEGNVYRYHTAFCYIESLKPGEEKIVNSEFFDESKSFVTTYHNFNSSNFNNNESLTENFIRLLIKQGLTRNESVEFVDYWFDEWFKTGGYTLGVTGYYSSLIYTMPQDIYDSLLPIRISPNPEKIKRIGLFYITGVPVHLVNDMNWSDYGSNLEAKEYLVKKYNPGFCFGIPGPISEKEINFTIKSYPQVADFVRDKFNTSSNYELYLIILKMNTIFISKLTNSSYYFAHSSGSCTVIHSFQGLLLIDEKGLMTDIIIKDYNESLRYPPKMLVHHIS